MIRKTLSYAVIAIVTIVALTLVLLQNFYKPITTGTVHLKNVKDSIEILKEVETSIPHVFTSSLEMAVYGMGYSHAQDRLWQLEKTRRLASGTLSEIFGEKAINLDKFMRTIGFRRVAEEIYPGLTQRDLAIFQAYADGINDFVDGIKVLGVERTAKVFPPEFSLLGISFNRWTPVDSLTIMRLLSFTLSWNWTDDLSRDFIADLHPELKEMVDEIYPINSEFAYNLVTIMNNEEAQENGFWSDESLLEKYLSANGKLTDEKKAELEEEEMKRDMAELYRHIRDETVERKKREAEEAKEAQKKRRQEENEKKNAAALEKEQEETDEEVEDEEGEGKGKSKDKKTKAKKAKDALTQKEKHQQEVLSEMEGFIDPTVKPDTKTDQTTSEAKTEQQTPPKTETKSEEKPKEKEQPKPEKQAGKDQKEDKKEDVKEKAKEQAKPEEAPKKAEEKAAKKEEKAEPKKQEKAESKKEEKTEKKKEEKVEQKKEEKAEQKKPDQKPEKKQEEKPKAEKEQKQEKKPEQAPEQKKEEKVEQKKEKVEKKVEEKVEEKVEKKQEKKEEKKEAAKEAAKEKVEQKKEGKKPAKAEEAPKDSTDKASEKTQAKAEQPDKKKGKKTLAQTEEAEFVEDILNLKDQMASNAFAIHGNKTEDGHPYLATDPHLSAQLPNLWYLMGLHLGDDYFIGATYPGMPVVAQGKTEFFSWGNTCPLADITDLFREKIDFKTNKYFVDGEWRNLKVVRETIQVKGGSPVTHEVYYTHRGPVIEQSEQLNNAQMLFGPRVPIRKGRQDFYSLAWTGFYPKENALEIMDTVLHSRSAKELFEGFDNLGTYYSVPQQMTFAFQNGDIGNILLTTAPVRKDKTPYVGARVLDGTTSKTDWEENQFLPIKDLPRLSNPFKGYIVAANNRMGYEKVKHDLGQTMTTTARAQRLVELIEKKLERNVAITEEMVSNFQMDGIDIQAREVVGPIVRIATANLDLLPKQERADALESLALIQRWRGLFGIESQAATVYSVWQSEFFASLFKKYTDDLDSRLAVVSNYQFNDFYQRMIKGIEKEQTDPHFNKICEKGFPEYKGNKPCAYNIAKSFALATKWLKEEVSKNSDFWAWSQVHAIEYANTPWSQTPLKKLFHKEVAAGGNANTINVSGYRRKEAIENKNFNAFHTPTYRQLIHPHPAPQNNTGQFVHEGGQNGNLFGGHYFDFNWKHNHGRFNEMKQSHAQLKYTKHDQLYLRPHQGDTHDPSKKKNNQMPTGKDEI